MRRSSYNTAELLALPAACDKLYKHGRNSHREGQSDKCELAECQGTCGPFWALSNAPMFLPRSLAWLLVLSHFPCNRTMFLSHLPPPALARVLGWASLSALSCMFTL
jgi:hypothetical protein